MKKPFIRLLALCLTALILVTLASCKKTPAPSGEETTTVPAVTEVPTTLPVAPTDAPSTLPATTAVPETTTGVPETTTAPATTAAPTTEATTAAPAADPASWSREQMVAFVSDAVNKSKAYAGSLTADHNQSFTFEIKSVSPGGAIIQPISQTIVNNLLKPTTETLSFSGGTATDSDGETVPILLPKKQGFALTAAGVASASASANGTDVTVTLTLIPETGNLTAVPANNAAAIGYLDASKVTSLSLFSVEKFDVSYPGSTLKITVNADGYVTAAEYSTPVAIEGAGKIGLIPGSLSSSGESKESWVLHW